MNHFTRHLTLAAAIGIAAAATLARADEDERRAGRNAYVVTSLVSNLPGHARVQDPVLQNAWGVAFSPAGSPFWVNDNGTGCSTLYTGDGTQVPLQVSIPLPGNVVPSGSCHAADPNKPGNPAPATPTGIVWRPLVAPLSRYPWSVLWRAGDASEQVSSLVRAARTLSERLGWLQPALAG